MKFKLKQEKMVELMEKLSLVDMYPSVVMVIKKDEKSGKPVLFSIQREASGRALRYLRLMHTFFDSIEAPYGPLESIEVDSKRVVNAVKKFAPGTMLNIEKEGNKLKISGECAVKSKENNGINKIGTSTYITFYEPEKVVAALPIAFKKNGTPVLGKKNIQLNVHIKISLNDLKEAIKYASVFKTDLFKFEVKKDQKLTLRIGDLREFSDYWIFKPRYEMKADDELFVILTYGIKQIASVFRSDVNIRASTNAPCWIYEKTDDYTLGVLIPPYETCQE